jgi:NAD(P)-dependent dehydrogenase (short-subunit alcohol dehydrogenase family)
MEMKNAKTAVVTGGGTGVGKAVALALAGAGYQVVVAGRRQAPLDETCAEAQAKYGAGERMLGIATDVSDPAAVEQLFARTVQRFGRVDLLFNNAGRGNPPGSFLDWTPEQWREVVDVNLNGMF